MERLTVKWTDKVYDTLDPVDILDNEYSKINYNKLLTKLGEYEDLEDRLNGVSVKQVVDGFIKTVENQTNEEYEHGRILTNAEADEWNEYKQLDEQGLLLRLPCKVGDTVYRIENGKITQTEITKYDIYADGSIWFSFSTSLSLPISKFKTCIFFTQAEAEKKLKEMERD